MAFYDARLTPAGDLKKLVRSEAIRVCGGNPDSRYEVERAMSEMPVDWDNLPEDGHFIAKLVGLIADAVRIHEELTYQ